MIGNAKRAAGLIVFVAAALSPCAFARADDNFGAANGPLPGDVALYQKEQACAEALKTPGYFQSINAAELADAQRSGTYPCATFIGSFDGPNQVYAWRVFVVDDRTTCLVALIGPKDKRVMMTSNQHYDVPFEPMMLALGTGFYKEQVRWRDAATGRLIAESDLMEPMSINTAVTPGFGGRVYYPTDSGFVVLQLKAKM
jgi:hypothetical protein